MGLGGVGDSGLEVGKGESEMYLYIVWESKKDGKANGGRRGLHKH